MSVDLPPDCQTALNAPVMQQIFHVESSNNPFAIGVVRNRLVRQPQNLDDAVATANYLQKSGYNFSIGKGQVNKTHFARLGWDDLTKGFDVCNNVIAAHQIFKDCYASALSAGYQENSTGYTATHAALSCYYSGRHAWGTSVPDVARYVNDVLSVKTASNAEAPKNEKGKVIPLANANKSAVVKVKKVSVSRGETSSRLTKTKQSVSMMLNFFLN